MAERRDCPREVDATMVRRKRIADRQRRAHDGLGRLLAGQDPLDRSDNPDDGGNSPQNPPSR